MTDYIVVDLETTGFSSDIHEIIEIGAYKVINNVAVEQFTTLVKPKNYIPRNIETITGITNEMLKTASHIEDILPKFYEWQKGYPLLGHNIGFDYEFLCKTGKMYGLDFTEAGSKLGIDTLKLSKRYLNLKSNKLADVAAHFDIHVESDVAYHRAKYDAFVTKLIYDKLLEMNMPDIKIPEDLTVKDRKYGKVVNNDTLSFN